MRPSSAKAKGRKLQQVVRDIVLKSFPQLSDKDVKSTTMGESGIDVQLSEAARKLFPWATECKNYGKVAIYAWWEQATMAADKEGLQPLLVVKANHKEPLACIRLEDFMTLTKGVTPSHGTTESRGDERSQSTKKGPSECTGGYCGQSRSSFEALP